MTKQSTAEPPERIWVYRNMLGELGVSLRPDPPRIDAGETVTEYVRAIPQPSGDVQEVAREMLDGIGDCDDDSCSHRPS